MKTFLFSLSLVTVAILPACSKKPVNVTGQIFVVTKGRENIKMGGVDVRVIQDAEFQTVARTTAAWMQEEVVRNEAQSRADSDYMTAFIKEVKAMEEAAPYPNPRLESIRMEIVKESGIAERHGTSALLPDLLKRSFAKLLSESSSPAVVSTDADGRFTFPIKGKTWFLAAAERAVGKGSEEYLWVKSFEAPEGAENATMTISNNDDIDSEELLYGVLNHSIGAAGGLDSFRKVEVSEKMTTLVAKYREAAKVAQAKAEAGDRPGGAGRVVPRFASPTEDEALALVRRGMAARDAESIGHCFRLGQAKPAEVISFLADLEREHGKPDRLDWLSSMDTEGMQLEGVVVNHERGGTPAGRIAFLIPDDRGVWRIDFEAFARMCRPALAELAKPEVQSAVLRVLIAKDSYFNGPFRDDSQWLCFAMASPDLGDKESGDRTVMRGYCKTESPQAKALLQLFADGGSTCRTTLEIRKVEGADDMQFEITRVLSREWVTGEQPLDAKYGAL